MGRPGGEMSLSALLQFVMKSIWILDYKCGLDKEIN